MQNMYKVGANVCQFIKFGDVKDWMKTMKTEEELINDNHCRVVYISIIIISSIYLYII